MMNDDDNEPNRIAAMFMFVTAVAFVLGYLLGTMATQSTGGPP